MALNLGTLVGYVTLDDTKFNQGVDRTQGRLGGLGHSIVGVLGRAVRTGGLALGGLGIAGTVMGVKVSAGNEQAKISFTTMLGSARKADKFLRQLQKFAAKTPFEFPELQTAASSLISVGIKAKNVLPIMTSLGNATSGMGTGSEGIKRATVALQQMNAAGRITAEDLNQLRDAGVPVFDLLTAATGKTTKQIAAMAQNGKLGAKELKQLMAALENGKGLERFNGLMDKQSRSLTGLWSTFKDTLGQGLGKLVGKYLPLLKTGLSGAIAGVGGALGGVQSAVDFIGRINWERLGHKAVSGIKAGLSGAKHMWGALKPDLVPFAIALYDGAKATAQNLIDGIQTGLQTGDWGPLGKTVGDSLVTALGGAGDLTHAFGSLLTGIDWRSLGVQAAQAAVPFVISFTNELTGAFLSYAKQHPVDVIQFLLTIIPFGRVAGVLEKVLGKLPILGPLLRLISKAGEGVEKGIWNFIVKPLGKIGGFIVDALIGGIRLVFPKAGNVIERELGLIGTRIGLFALKLRSLGRKLIDNLVEAIRSKITEVGASGALVVAKILKAFGGIAGKMATIGLHVVQGLARGIANSAHLVVDAAKSLADILPGWVKKVLNIGSPSKVMYALGGWAGKGLAYGIESAIGLVKSATKKLTDQLDAVKTKIADIKSKAADVRSGVADSIRGAFDVSGLGGSPTGAVNAIAAMAARATKFAALIKQLVKEKLDPRLVAQIAGEGPDAGMAEASALARATKGQVRAINGSFGQINSAAVSAGRAVANEQFGKQQRHWERVEDKLDRLIEAVKNGPRSGRHSSAHSLAGSG